jgi:hypothetical protein
LISLRNALSSSERVCSFWLSPISCLSFRAPGWRGLRFATSRQLGDGETVDVAHVVDDPRQLAHGETRRDVERRPRGAGDAEALDLADVALDQG